ncbi:MAG: hypothetical protein WC565_02790 [Parcubacteria group bacterium]
MKINSKNIKKHARNIKNASEEEISRFREEYHKLMGNVETINSPLLLVLALIGVFIILYFKNNFFDIIGLIILIYPFYLFVRRGSHEEGFFEGYYDFMTKERREGNSDKDEKDKKDSNK